VVAPVNFRCVYSLGDVEAGTWSHHLNIVTILDATLTGRILYSTLLRFERQYLPGISIVQVHTLLKKYFLCQVKRDFWCRFQKKILLA
jgi:hypothetical protein